MPPSPRRTLHQATRRPAAHCCRSFASAMERFIQILDDLDDLIGAIGLIGERIRSLLLAISFTCVAISIQAGGVILALIHPPLALATAIIMFVTLLYRTVTSAHQGGHLAPQ